MSPVPRVAIAASLLAWVAGCRRTPEPAVVATHASDASIRNDDTTTDVGSDARDEGDASDAIAVDAAPADRDVGPFTFEFAPKRSVYVVAARSTRGPQRLVAMLHGICNPPEYACGLWADTAMDLGFLVCPRGEGDCGANAYHAPTWTKPEAKIDEDLESAIGVATAQFPDGSITREGAVLVGFSRGGYMSINFALAHPGRWPYLVINEANVPLSVSVLKKAGVKAVALIAGEIGGQLPGERATAAALEKEGYPARLWVMPKAGHWYSDDIGQIMKEAIDFVTAH